MSQLGCAIVSVVLHVFNEEKHVYQTCTDQYFTSHNYVKEAQDF